MTGRASTSGLWSWSQWGVPRLQQIGAHLGGGGVRRRDHDVAQVVPHPSGLGGVPVTDEVEHRRASGDRAEHPLSGHREGPGGVFGQDRFQLQHIQLVQGVGVVRHRLLEFGDHEATVSTILPWMWPCAARVCALTASDSG
ncbi:hypothetical protein GCM10010260_81390 [Streptomyces filipinensis]|uniref:Uncharacterized protein n=1 Tax=Streptomyces filipinensis TaxID=66887 RepID=A0A918MGF3_9ACTN|nr:hypothetical protein GCM10010260_81390 [Streptomyces filipinensis]